MRTHGERDGEPNRARLNDVHPAAPHHQLHALQEAAGNQAIQRWLTVQRWDWPWASPRMPDLTERTERSLAAKKEFVANPPPPLKGFAPSTGIGRFDVAYDPRQGVLDVTVRCSFVFEDGEETRLVTRSGRVLPPGPLPPDVDLGKDPVTPQKYAVRWTSEEKRNWKLRFMAYAEATWSEQFTFWCGRDHWEDLHATVRIDFAEVPPEGTLADSPFRVRVQKGAGDRSHVGRQGSPEAVLVEGDLESTIRPDGHSSNAGAHEAGHMLGLGDEYQEAGRPDFAEHSDLVKAEFGHEVRRGTVNPDSIMTGGILVLPEHGVTMLEALKAVTHMDEWSHVRRTPTGQ